MKKVFIIATIIAAAMHGFFDIGVTPEEVKAFIQTEDYKKAEIFYLSR